MSDLVAVGRVGRPHGLDGAFVVEQPSDNLERYAVGATLYVDGEPATVVVSPTGRCAPPRDQARPAGRARATAGRSAGRAARTPGRTSTTSSSSSGSPSRKTAQSVGDVQDVLPGVANDNLELDSGTLVPLIEDAIREIDVAGGRIVLNPGFIT